MAGSRVCAVIAIGLSVGLAGCVEPPPTGPIPVPGATWVAGDSISVATAWPKYTAPRLASVAVSGSAFVSLGNRADIATNTLAAVALYGTPGRVIIMGGVNDRNGLAATVEQVTEAMASLESALADQGVETIWATEPAWNASSEMSPVNDWIRGTRGRVIDCADSISAAKFSQDGSHPTSAGYKILARCIDEGLASLSLAVR